MAKPHKNPPLTWERLDELFCVDTDRGTLIWKANSGKKRMIGRLAGDLRHRFGYVQISIDKVIYRRSRLIWFYVHRDWPEELDHINGIRNDDRITNLRPVTRAQNMWNAKKLTTNKSGHKGVSWHKQLSKWRANIRCNGKWYHLGTFNEIDDAIMARKSAELRLYQGFARQ